MASVECIYDALLCGKLSSVILSRSGRFMTIGLFMSFWIINPALTSSLVVMLWSLSLYLWPGKPQQRDHMC